MKHKKLMALLLTACMVMGTVGCGGGSSAPATPPADGGTGSTQTESAAEEAPEETAAPSGDENLSRGG